MIAFILLIAALVILIASAIGATAGKVNLTAAGLACWVASSVLAYYSL